jgi:hypothetical protein
MRTYFRFAELSAYDLSSGSKTEDYEEVLENNHNKHGI